MLFEGLGWIGNFLFFVLSCWISVVLDLSLVLCEYMRDLLKTPLCIPACCDSWLLLPILSIALSGFPPSCDSATPLSWRDRLSFGAPLNGQLSESGPFLPVLKVVPSYIFLPWYKMQSVSQEPQFSWSSSPGKSYRVRNITTAIIIQENNFQLRHYLSYVV
jgi:hypothetical protein